LVFYVSELLSAVEQVVLEEYYEIEIQLFVKWRPSLKSALHEALGKQEELV